MRTTRLTTALVTFLTAALAALLLAVSPVGADEGGWQLTWEPLTGPDGEARDDGRLFGEVRIRGRLEGERPIQRWRLRVVAGPDAAHRGFGQLCDQDVTEGGKSVEVNCPWDTRTYPNGGYSHNDDYRIRVGVWGAGGGKEEPDQILERAVTLENPAAPPRGVALDYDRASSQMTLSWKANPEPDLAKYLVEERLDQGPWTVVAEPSETSHQRQLEQPGTYRYRVAAVRKAAGGGLTAPSPAAPPSGRGVDKALSRGRSPSEQPGPGATTPPADPSTPSASAAGAAQPSSPSQTDEGAARAPAQEPPAAEDRATFDLPSSPAGNAGRGTTTARPSASTPTALPAPAFSAPIEFALPVQTGRGRPPARTPAAGLGIAAPDEGFSTTLPYPSPPEPALEPISASPAPAPPRFQEVTGQAGGNPAAALGLVAGGGTVLGLAVGIRCRFRRRTAESDPTPAEPADVQVATLVAAPPNEQPAYPSGNPGNLNGQAAPDWACRPRPVTGGRSHAGRVEPRIAAELRGLRRMAEAGRVPVLGASIEAWAWPSPAMVFGTGVVLGGATNSPPSAGENSAGPAVPHTDR